MESLQVNAIFPAIAAADAAEFKQVAADVLKVASSEPGTLQYDWFFSDDGGRCVVREAYASSDAVLEHLGHVGPMLGRLVDSAAGSSWRCSGIRRRRSPRPSLVRPGGVQLRPRQVARITRGELAARRTTST